MTVTEATPLVGGDHPPSRRDTRTCGDRRDAGAPGRRLSFAETALTAVVLFLTIIGAYVVFNNSSFARGENDERRMVFLVGGEGSGHHYFGHLEDWGWVGIQSFNIAATCGDLQPEKECFFVPAKQECKAALRTCMTALTSMPLEASSTQGIKSPTLIDWSLSPVGPLSYPYGGGSIPNMLDLKRWTEDIARIHVVILVRDYGEMLLSNLHRFHRYKTFHGAAAINRARDGVARMDAQLGEIPLGDISCWKYDGSAGFDWYADLTGRGSLASFLGLSDAAVGAFKGAFRTKPSAEAPADVDVSIAKHFEQRGRAADAKLSRAVDQVLKEYWATDCQEAGACDQGQKDAFIGTMLDAHKQYQTFYRKYCGAAFAA